jgi:hypothetical protein
VLQGTRSIATRRRRIPFAAGSSLSDDAGALDDVADSGLETADWVAVLARGRRYPLDIRLALAAT